LVLAKYDRAACKAFEGQLLDRPDGHDPRKFANLSLQFLVKDQSLLPRVEFGEWQRFGKPGRERPT
jgi:hypothetical protein